MGYIYKLVCNITNEVYYGKSTMKYPKRLYYHKSNPSGSSKTIIERGNYNFILVEDNIEDLIDLTNREYYYITNFECINITIPFTNEDNKLNRHREEEKQRYYDNKEIILQKRKEFYEANKERLNAIKQQVIECNCGQSYMKGNQSRHFKSDIHKKYLDSIC
jgi:hypothetical protein